MDDKFLGAAAFSDVAFDAACKTYVWISINKKFEVEEIAELGIGENEDALNDDDGEWIELDRFGGACVQCKVVGGH